MKDSKTLQKDSQDAMVWLKHRKITATDVTHANFLTLVTVTTTAALAA